MFQFPKGVLKSEQESKEERKTGSGQNDISNHNVKFWRASFSDKFIVVDNFAGHTDEAEFGNS